jgi:hypothetical protein
MASLGDVKTVDTKGGVAGPGDGIGRGTAEGSEGDGAKETTGAGDWGAGRRAAADGSASGAPHSRQNWAPPSDGARQRGQNLGAGAGPPPTNSTKRAGAMAAGAPWGGASGATSVAGAVALRSTVPVGPRLAGRGVAAGGEGDAAAGAAAAIRYPHVTQKRTLGWLVLPQLGQAPWPCGVGAGSVRAAKLIWGAGGRCGTGVGRLTVSGASAVAASGDGDPRAAAGTPSGGVGATTRGASL